jgi:predicted  nucleic acid-binding Zn-ribbon protein
MPNLSETFRIIHRLRQHARELQTEIERAPLNLKARQTVAAKPAKALEDGKELLKKLKVTTLERESDLKAQHKQIERWRQQQSDAVDQKQYETLKHEITAAEVRCTALEETIITTMGQAEELAPKIPALEAAAAKAQQDFAAFQTEQKERLARLAEELQRATEELKVAEANVPEDIRPEYARRIASYGADALASAAGSSCSHCHTSIAAQVMIHLGMGHFVTCTSCYRALYLPE